MEGTPKPKNSENIFSEQLPTDPPLNDPNWGKNDADERPVEYLDDQYPSL